MGHETLEKSPRQEPEQYELFPDDEEVKKIMVELRENEPRYRNYPLNDPALKERAELVLAHRKSGKPSVNYHSDPS
jgi:hypothetical protein